MNYRAEYTDVNSKTWDQWAKKGIEWSVPITHEEYEQIKDSVWGVYLTPCRTVPREWFLPFTGSKLLGLASGGGQQMPIFAALGAQVTVFDYSQKQLEAEEMVARREDYPIEIVHGDMTKTLPFADNSFDMIFHPVSNCYIEDVLHVWRECYRVLRPGGVLLAGMDNSISFLFEGEDPLRVVNRLPFNPLVDCDDEELARMVENHEGVQFSHSIEEQLGGQLKAGLQLTDIFDDHDREGCGVLREYTPTYIASRAVKP